MGLDVLIDLAVRRFSTSDSRRTVPVSVTCPIRGGLQVSDSLLCHLDDQTIAFEGETLGLGLGDSILSVLKRAELNEACTL